VEDLGDLGKQSFCYLTTRGRVTGNPHEIEIWFAARGLSIYLLSGGSERSDWVKNLVMNPDVTVRIGKREFGGQARIVEDADEEAWARTALLEKYGPGYGGDLTNWSQRSLPVAIDLSA
jgi:deazaflavin-dependent oxidoreductase (nitroreductase family)